MRKLLLFLALNTTGFATAKDILNDFHFLGSQPSVVTPVDEGREQLVTKIISDPEGGIVHALLFLMNEDGTFSKIIRRSSRNQQIIEPEALFKGEVVLARASERDAVLMSCHGCNTTQGGTVLVKYLYNGITMSYRSLSLQLVYVNNTWILNTDKGVKAETLRLVKRELMGRTIGIDEIRINR